MFTIRLHYNNNILSNISNRQFHLLNNNNSCRKQIFNKLRLSKRYNNKYRNHDYREYCTTKSQRIYTREMENRNVLHKSLSLILLLLTFLIYYRFQ